MANLYENIEKLCKQRGVNVTTMCNECNVICYTIRQTMRQILLNWNTFAFG